METARPGLIDDNYELVRELGRGGMGVVYEARHLRTGGRVALKLIASEVLGADDAATMIRRFQREARATAAIDSQHVVQVTDTGVDAASGRPYIVMEYLAGEDLRAVIRRLGPLAPDVVLRIAAQACLGLHRAHERGIVHRDIKSANLHLAPRDADQAIVKIVDFGIAKVLADAAATESQHLTRSGSLLGSPLYMSPEQAVSFQDLDSRTDLWSLGVVMYEALSGQTPHGGSIGALILAICSKPAPPLCERAPWVPADVATVVHKALSLEPGQRFQTAMEMHAAICAALPDDATLRQNMLVPASARSADARIRSTPMSAPQLAHATANALTLNTDARLSDLPTPRRATGPGTIAVAGVVAVAAIAGIAAYRAQSATVESPPSAIASAPPGPDEQRDAGKTSVQSSEVPHADVGPLSDAPVRSRDAEPRRDAGGPTPSSLTASTSRARPAAQHRTTPAASAAAASSAPTTPVPASSVGPPMFDRTF